MASIENLISKLPPETQDLFRFVYDSLPESERMSFSLLAGGLPSNSTLLRMLVKLSATQLKMAFGKKKQVAIIGPANVGKSTLYNQLVQNPKDFAAVSPLPGTTRANQLADAGLFAIVDTPGADAVGDVGENERQFALDAAAQADFLIIMFDAIQGIKQTELVLFRQLLTLHKPYIVLLNKIDLAKREKEGIVNSAAKNLNLEPTQIIPITAKEGKNLDQVLLGIALTEPEMVAALGRSFPAYRRKLAWRSVVSGASGSVVVALAPLPFIDLIPLLAIQTVMVLGIARIYSYEITPVRAREILATFGLGFVGRRLFYELTKLGGIPGWLLGAAIASSMTVTMGYAAILWFERGEKLSKDKLAQITHQMTQKLIKALKETGTRKPNAQSLGTRIAQILETIGLDEVDVDDTNYTPIPTQSSTPSEGEK